MNYQPLGWRGALIPLPELEMGDLGRRGAQVEQSNRHARLGHTTTPVCPPGVRPAGEHFENLHVKRKGQFLTNPILRPGCTTLILVFPGRTIPNSVRLVEQCHTGDKIEEGLARKPEMGSHFHFEIVPDRNSKKFEMRSGIGKGKAAPDFGYLCGQDAGAGQGRGVRKVPSGQGGGSPGSPTRYRYLRILTAQSSLPRLRNPNGFGSGHQSST